MAEFVSYKSFSDLVAYVAQKNNLNRYSELLNHSFVIQGLNSWDEIFRAGQSDSLFDDTGDLITIFDYSSLPLSVDIKDLISSAEDVLLVHRDEGVIAAKDKKIIKEVGSIVELKGLSKSDIEAVLTDYSAATEVGVDVTVKDHILAHAKSYDAVLVLLYIASMSENSIEALKEYQKVDQIGLFMLPWRQANLRKDVMTWLQSTKPEELQLALSLLMTKTLKWKDSVIRQEVVDILIKADNTLKTFTRSDVVYFKSVMWNIAHIGN